jgi:uncharacterized protein YqjF (DUF2071 family)
MAPICRQEGGCFHAARTPVSYSTMDRAARAQFKVPADAIARLAPAGTEPDLFDGEAYLSVVGFMFRDARLFGLAAPAHGRFEEVNLRYYVRREFEG